MVPKLFKAVALCQMYKCVCDLATCRVIFTVPQQPVFLAAMSWDCTGLILKMGHTQLAAAAAQAAQLKLSYIMLRMVCCCSDVGCIDPCRSAAAALES